MKFQPLQDLGLVPGGCCAKPHGTLNSELHDKGAWPADDLSGTLTSYSKLHRSRKCAAFLQCSSIGSGNSSCSGSSPQQSESAVPTQPQIPARRHHAGFLEVEPRRSGRVFNKTRSDAANEISGFFSQTPEAGALRHNRAASFVAPAEQAGHAHHTNGEEHQGGSHHAAAGKTEEELHCEKATDISSCVDVTKGCVWSMDNVGIPNGGGSCSYTEPEHWPHGIALATEIMVIPIAEGTILVIAVFLRQRARLIIADMGMDPSRSDLRRAVWLLPTVGAYVFIACIYFKYTQDWLMKSTVYFLIQVVTSVGYGDMAPTHPVTKMFTVCHILLGICIVGGALGDELDNVIHSRVQRLVYKVREAADWQQTTQVAWPRILQLREMLPGDQWMPLVDMLKSMYDPFKLNSPNQAQVQDGIRRLGITTESSIESALVQELFQGINELPAGDASPEEASPQEMALMQDVSTPGERLRVFIPLMEHANLETQAPRFTQGEAMNQFASGAMMDRWAAELFWPSLQQFVLSILVIGSVFGLADEFLYVNNARTLVDSFYMAVVTTTTVGFGDITPQLPVERVFGSICMIVGCYCCNKYILASSELFAWKTELSADLIESLPPGFGTHLQRLRAGGEDRASYLARRLSEQGSLKGGDPQTLCKSILDEYDHQVQHGAGVDASTSA